MAERLPDFGEPGAPSATVDPSVGTSPSSSNQSAAQQPDPSATAGAPAAPAGSSGEGDASAPGSPPAQPPETPAPQQPAEGQPPQAPTQPPEGQQPAAAQPPQAQQPPEGEDEPDLTTEGYEQLKGKLREELTGEFEEQRRTQQGGQDRAMANVQQKLDESTERLDQMTNEVREGKLQGLSPEEQTTLRKSWELDDREKKLNEYAKSLESFHGDTDVLALLNEYGQFGVTEQELLAVPVDERELFCAEKRSEYWEQKAKGGQANGQPAAPQQPAPAPQQPVPAGASAPSDAGGGGSVPPVAKPNTDQGPDAMTDNISQRDSWESANFQTSRRG